jgi:hypothetical protein
MVCLLLCMVQHTAVQGLRGMEYGVVAMDYGLWIMEYDDLWGMEYGV